MAKVQRDKVVDLTDRLRESREQVLERLFKEHGAALRSFLLARMGQSSDLEDIVQDVFVRLARMDDLNERLPKDGSRNRAFIYTVANNLLVDLYRHQSIQLRYCEQLPIEQGVEKSDESPEARALAREELDQISEVIMGMRPRWRDAFILTRFRHKSYQQVASDMGVTVRQVERYVTKAIVQIRKAAMDIKGVT